MLSVGVLNMNLLIKNITHSELEEFINILNEARTWLKNQGMEMWNENQVTAQNLLKNNSLDQMYIAYSNKESAAVMILQEEDTLWSDDESRNDSLFLHKLAIRRRYAKSGLSQEMINWAKNRAKQLNKMYLKLDCAADRPKLCKFYESQGFKKVREKLVLGKYSTAFYEFHIT